MQRNSAFVFRLVFVGFASASLNLGVVEVVGSNPAGPISENPAFLNGLQGFFVSRSNGCQTLK